MRSHDFDRRLCRTRLGRSAFDTSGRPGLTAIAACREGSGQSGRRRAEIRGVPGRFRGCCQAALGLAPPVSFVVAAA